MEMITELLQNALYGLAGELGAIVLAVLTFVIYRIYKYAKENWSWFKPFIEWTGVLRNEEEVKDWAFRMAEKAFDKYLQEYQEKGENVVIDDYVEEAAMEVINNVAPKAFEFAGLEKKHVKEFVEQRWRELRDSS